MVGERRADETGFGLVELVIAVFILALIAVAMLPALYGGFAQSSTQSQTATATRFVYGVIEQAREDAASAPGTYTPATWCDHVTSLAGMNTPASMTVAIPKAPTDKCVFSAGNPYVVTVTLVATSTKSTHPQLAAVSATAYLPPKASAP